MLIYLLSLTQAWALNSTELVRPYPKLVLRNEIVEFKPIAEHHFSGEAPQTCGSGSLLDRSPRTIKCQFTAAGASLPILNVCDDKKTYCRPNELQISVQEKESSTPIRLIKNQTLNKEIKHMLEPGFTEGSPAEIRKQAAERGQPVFLMISTDWCPPCNEAKEFLLSSPGFQKATQNWFKVYVDGDSLEAGEWYKVVAYHYFPSFVLLNSKLQEVSRYTGGIRQNDFAKWAARESTIVNQPIEDLKVKVMARVEGSWKQKLKDLWQRVSADEQHHDLSRLLKWSLDTEDGPLSKRLVAKGLFPELQSEILRAQLTELEERENQNGQDLKAAKVETYRKLLDSLFRKDSWAENLNSFCALDKVACNPIAFRADERLKFLESRMDVTEMEKASLLAEEYYYLAEVYQTVGDAKAVKEFALKCVGNYQGLNKGSFLKTPRSAQQGMVACLELAGDFKKAEAALKALAADYPTEPTFMLRMARTYIKQKKFSEALAWLEKAEAVTYGYNWFMAQILKADILISQSKPLVAEQILNDALGEITLDSSQDSRNQGLVAKLRSMQTKVEKSRNN